MQVESPIDSLLQSLKLEDPWLPPRPWESIPSESGGVAATSASTASSSSSHDCLYELSSVSESSLVRLVMNALQGAESALLSIEKLSSAFCNDPADRSSHHIRTLWNHSLSTYALGKMLKSIGYFGSLVMLLYKFVEHFTSMSFDKTWMENRQVRLKPAENQNDENIDVIEHSSSSLVNQAFAVAIRKVLEGYLCALDALCSSVQARHSLNSAVRLSETSLRQGSLTSIVHSEVTILEVYLHTIELRTQVEALGNLCHICDAALCFSLCPFEDLTLKAAMQFSIFPRGGNLLTYLYNQLQVADPAHCALLKFLFLRSLEPYCGFLRSWIYEAKVTDPYREFIIKYGESVPLYSSDKGDVCVDFPLVALREQEEVAAPCFLKDISVPLLRAGQQLQIVMKLLQLCKYVDIEDNTLEAILPGSNDCPINRLSDSMPLSFNKGKIETMVILRKNLYRRMHEKLEYFMKILDIKYRQVVFRDAAYASQFGRTIEVQLSSTLDDSLLCPSPSDERDPNEAPQNADSDASSMRDDVLDIEPFECSSTDGSEKQEDPAETAELPDGFVGSKHNYLSALSFSSSISFDKTVQKSTQNVIPESTENGCIDPQQRKTMPGKTDAFSSKPLDHFVSWISQIQYADHQPNLGWPVGGLLENPFCSHLGHKAVPGIDPNISASKTELLEERSSCSYDQFTPRSLLGAEAFDLEQFENRSHPSANSYVMQSWNAKFQSNVLSMNPMLTKSAFLPRGINKNFPYFNFSATENHFKSYAERTAGGPKHQVGPDLSSCSDSGPSSIHHADVCGDTPYSSGDISVAKDDMLHNRSSLSLKDNSVTNSCSDKTYGGSGWQSLLRGFASLSSSTSGDSEQDPVAKFEMPLDFIISKCLLQEILLQYYYVSRLTIKLLEEGFDLQGHLLALRQYHFMEVADWADLFITSLWHHKWYFMKEDQSISEIQGLLESSIQRSSRERDCNKDRLYIYVKDHSINTFPIASVGVQTFDFIGLGYRVDWPVSIVLTPSALRIYANIFSFLIRVKLAVLSLTDVWFCLKDLRRIFNHSRDQHQMSRSHFSSLIKLRHQVNHFVSTLQHYVLSQLSDVSWCRFCHALEHKVNDVMDLESVHMAYLADSLRICFQVDETKSISKIIESILQCALDFRSCLVKGTGIIGLETQDSRGSLSHIAISEVFTIKETFDKNMKELYLCYLKSPKHEEFGLSRFWGYLNYNEYYSDTIGNETRHCSLFVT